MTIDSRAVPAALPAQGIAPAFVRDPLAWRIFLLAAALGVAFDPLFFEEPPGIQFPVFVCLALLALWTTALRQTMPATDAAVNTTPSADDSAGNPAPAPETAAIAITGLGAAAAVSVLAIVCSGFVFVRAESYLTVWNAAATLALLALVAALLHGKRLLRTSLVGLAFAEAWTAVHAAILPFQLAPRAVDLSSSRAGARALVPIGRGVALAVPVLLVFAGLMASADAVFEQYVDDIFDFAFMDDLVEWTFRILLMTAVAWFAAGWMGAALRPTNIPCLDDEDDGAAVLPGMRRWIRIGVPEATTLLVLVELLFAAFVVIQVRYLFGGEQSIGVNGLTYADYARSGFFELVAVAGLSLGLLLALNDLTKRVGPSQRLVFRVLSTTLVGLVLVILVSAFQRLSLYEAAYGYTHLRLIVHTFIAWLAVALAWCAWSLWTHPRRFALGALVCAAGFLLSLDVMNPDALIVRRNVQRYQVTGDVDLHYLESLSSDATPALAAALPVLRSVEGSPNPDVYPTWVPLEDDLAARAKRLARHPGNKAGPGFNLAEWRAGRALDAMPGLTE